MRKRLKQAALVMFGVFAAAQLIRPARTNPGIDATRTIRATASDVGAVVDRSCRDCHSNATVWPAYTQVAPLSWLMAYAVTKGRTTLNFSEWTTYSPEQQRLLLAVSCDDVTNGKMPGPYRLLHPETRLTARDIAMICAAARQAEARSGVATQ
jgi:hypothetical protein